VAHPFSTPSGKLEIFSTTLAASPDPYGLGPIPPIPTWIPPHRTEGRYPLEMVSPKSRARTHSTHDNQEVLARADRQDVWLHPDDAAARGIADGEHVRVYNERGQTVLPARVTDRVARGVVSIKEGAWFALDAGGRDRRGCANVLTEDRAAPSGASTYNTCRVEIEPWTER
jgi:anaerobic dimethyl sulfoxide reductase subunit A